MKFAFQLLVFLAAWGVAGFTLLAITQPEWQSPVYRQLVRLIPWAGYLHLFAGSIALLLGVFQFQPRIRQSNIELHKLMGRVYVGCVLASTLGAFVSVWVSPSSWAAKSAFWILAVLWPTVTLLGYPWRGTFNAHWHARWMTLSYALTCAAITLRIILGILLGIGVSFQSAYPIAAWGGVLTNLCIANIIIFGLFPRQKIATVARR